MRTRIVLFSTLLFSIVLSCRWPDCINKDPVFDENEPTSEIYQKALIKELDKAGLDHFGYWFDSYVEEDNKEYIWVKIQGYDLCARAKLRVLDW